MGAMVTVKSWADQQAVCGGFSHGSRDSSLILMKTMGRHVLWGILVS